jgi:ribosomal protein L29
MKITKELKNLSSQELASRKEELHKELLKMNSQKAMGSNPGKVRLAKKNIARILTLQNQK